MLSVRPKIAELKFQVFGRSLHPELFEFHRSRRIQRDAFHAEISITNSGHVVTWRGNGITISEVAASSQQLLPTRRRLMEYPLRGSRTDRAECRSGVTYSTRFTLEPVATDLFWTIQKQLTADATEGLLHRFDSNGRIAMGAVSYINIETRARSMMIQAIHTFPEDQAIVKVESTFAIDG
ncbi:hypothetical protein EC9_22360 [Rosistilla ulvae]|uniref:DUF2617 domain-containing protein n=1 Tax=Rosistilla ulvae TaxID=1930277 RepID=A0A517LZK4_9BACT|nr:DUF2617 family protein [Rosistilla ulvae]QDS88050.1 hypothetical protein EC9_22360 [Rosistilla ulvae]